MEILAIIPARGGSKGIPHKNIIDVCGKPLIQYTYEAVENCSLISRTILSTDDEMIAKTAEDYPVDIMMRPPELAMDSSTTADVIEYILNSLEENENYIPDIVLILQPTSPLRTGSDIDTALEMLIKDEDADSIVSVQEIPHNFIPEKVMCLKNGVLVPYMENSKEYTTRQLLPKYYGRNGAAIYAFYTHVFRATHSYYGRKCLPYIMSQEKSIDVDTFFDLEIVRYLIGAKNDNR